MMQEMISASCDNISKTPPRINGTHIFITGFIITLSFLLMPVWSVDVYPFVDHPVHLALVQIASEFHLSQPSDSQPFTHNWFTPYSATFILGKFLYDSVTNVLHFLPWIPLDTSETVEFVGKVILSIYIILTALSIVYFLKSVGQNAAYVFLTLPVLYNFNMAWGFMPFLLSIPILIFTLGWSIQVAQAKRAYFVLPVLTLLLFFSHLFAWLLAIILIPAILLTGNHSFRNKIRNLVIAFIPTGIVSLVWYHSLVYTAADDYFLKKSFRMAPISNKLRFFPEFVISGDGTNGFRFFFWLLVGIMVFYLVLFFAHHSRTFPAIRAWKSKDISAVRPMLILLMILIYIICPYSMLTAVWLYNRIAFLIFITLVLMLPSGNFPGRHLLDITCGIVCLIFSIYTTQFYMAFEKEVSPALEIIEQLPANRSLRMLLIDTRSRLTDHTPFDHIDQYYVIRKHGTVHNPFAVLTHMPIRYREPWLSQETTFRPEVFSTANGIKTDLRFSAYDYFMVRVPRLHPTRSVQLLFGEHLDDLTIRFQRLPWLLFEKKPEHATSISLENQYDFEW